MTYRPGWPVIEQMLVRRERWSTRENARVIPLAYPGQEVLADQPVLRLQRSEREVVAERHSSGPLWMELNSTRDNSYVTINAGETLPAGMHGRVVDITRRGGVIIECHASIVQGVIGVGSQVAGVLTIWQSGGSGRVPRLPAGAILVVPGSINFAFLRHALLSEINGIVASSIELRDLEGFLQTDLITLLNRNNVEQLQTHLPPITVCLTEGLGNLPMPAYILRLLTRHQGSVVLLSGVTSMRQSIVPELVISLPRKEVPQNWHPLLPDPSLVLNARVRISAGEHEGKIGVIDYFFVHQQLLPSGMRERVARLQCQDGSTLIMPLKLLERIGP